VREAADCLQGRGPEDLLELTLRLASHMLVLGGIEPDLASAERHCRRRLEDRSAWQRFLLNVELQGGSAEALLDPAKAPRARHIEALKAEASGYLKRIDAYRVGLACGLLGASRARKEDAVFPEVGVELLRAPGQAVRAGEEICLLHAREEQRLAEAGALLAGAVAIEPEPAPFGPLIIEEIDADALGKD